ATTDSGSRRRFSLANPIAVGLYTDPNAGANSHLPWTPTLSPHFVEHLAGDVMALAPVVNRAAPDTIRGWRRHGFVLHRHALLVVSLEFLIRSFAVCSAIPGAALSYPRSACETEP